MTSEKSGERREYIRAFISTRVTIKPVDPETFCDGALKAGPLPRDLDNLKAVATGADQAPPWVNRLAAYLVRIDEKLDRILDRLEENRPKASRRTTAAAREVSGSGMQLVLSERIDNGQHLIISLNLPGFPLNNIQAYGKVVRVSPRRGKDKGMFDVAVKFLYINETDREQLIAYSFCEQRKAIRAGNSTDSG